jgi:2-methylcitrate dehydratase PrpD
VPTRELCADLTGSALKESAKQGGDVTYLLAARASATSFEGLPTDIVVLSKQCALDAIGVAVAGAAEPAAQLVRAEVEEAGDAPVATIFGSTVRASAVGAALANGTAAHALDFDDVHMGIPGHASAAIVPALWALAEERHASGSEMIAAFVAGFETACRVGSLVAPGHYDAGFHATGTIGAIGSAAACATLLDLDAPTTAHALGIAVAQTAGLKSMVGTMCKPLHAGKAAANGLLAARLAARGFRSRLDALECSQGFAATHSPDCHPAAAAADPPEGFYLRENIFKYHAACMLTHPVIEAARSLGADEHVQSADIVKIRARVGKLAESVCVYSLPATGLEAKFSIPYAASAVLAGRDTGRLDTFDDRAVRDAEVVRLIHMTEVEFDDKLDSLTAVVQVQLATGARREATHDAGQPEADLNRQQERLEHKFGTLTQPLLGKGRSGELRSAIGSLESCADVGVISRLALIDAV